MKKLLILDLDETLIHTETFKEADYLEEGTFDFKFKINDYYYFTRKRPFLKEFIDYAFNNFEVAIWTAAERDYAKIILKESNIDESKLEFFWTKERCTIKLNYESQKHYGVKNLSKVRRIGKWDLKDILIVDDIRETAENNYGNLINIKPFVYQSNDTELLKLTSYLEKIKDEPDFRRVEKRGWSN